MAIAVHELEQAQKARVMRPITEILPAALQGRLDYEQEARGHRLSERKAAALLYRKMQQWQREGMPSEWQVDYIRGWQAAIVASSECEAVTSHVCDIAGTFESIGDLLRFLRERSHVSRQEVVNEFASCGCPLNLSNYGKIERSEKRYPHFSELASLYKALIHAGVQIHPGERAAYLLLARKCMENKKNYRECVDASKWEQLASELATFDGDEEAVSLTPTLPPLSLQEFRHVQQQMHQVSRALTSLGALTGRLSTLLPKMSDAATELGLALGNLEAVTGQDKGGLAL